MMLKKPGEKYGMGLRGAPLALELLEGLDELHALLERVDADGVARAARAGSRAGGCPRASPCPSTALEPDEAGAETVEIASGAAGSMAR